MPTTPILTLCDDLVTALTDSWEPAEPDGVTREYFMPISDADNKEFEVIGRRVYIFPLEDDDDPETRGEDLTTYKVGILVLERYTDADKIPVEWVDERVDFVYTNIAQAFDFSHGTASFNRKLKTESVDREICNREKLRVGKLFYSFTQFVFHELRDA